MWGGGFYHGLHCPPPPPPPPPPCVYLMSPHMAISPKLPPSVLAYYKSSKPGGGNGLRTYEHNSLLPHLAPTPLPGLQLVEVM